MLIKFRLGTASQRTFPFPIDSPVGYVGYDENVQNRQDESLEDSSVFRQIGADRVASGRRTVPRFGIRMILLRGQ